VQMIVDRFVELPDGYLLTGHMVISNADWRNVIIDFDSISALDANSKSVSVLPSDESFGDNEFSLMVADKDFVGPLNIKMKSLWVKASDTEDLAFSFDAGKDPQIGQSWTVNKELSVAKKKVIIQTVKMVEDDSHNNQPSTIQGYSIQVKSEDMNNAGINCVGQQGAVSHFGQTRPLDSQEFLLENFYPDSIPTGTITCKLQDVQFKEAGEWSFDWQPVTGAK
jgi:hypothetical protein